MSADELTDAKLRQESEPTGPFKKNVISLMSSLLLGPVARVFHTGTKVKHPH